MRVRMHMHIMRMQVLEAELDYGHVYARVEWSDGAAEERGADATSHELTILSTALNNLFSGSSRLSDDAISHFLAALSTQCFTALAHESTSKERLASPRTAAAQPPRLFALRKFVDTALVNVDLSKFVAEQFKEEAAIL